MNETPAKVAMTLYFADKPPLMGKSLEVSPERVRCFCTGNAVDRYGWLCAAVGEKYAILLESDVDVVVRYGLLDLSDQPCCTCIT